MPSHGCPASTGLDRSTNGGGNDAVRRAAQLARLRVYTVRAIKRAIAMAPSDGNLAILSHGGVGALLLCHLKGVPISRTEDQPAGGGGNFYSFDVATLRLITGWHRIDE